jgi:outer membrane protein OmpA-like peptidoglycan-associated protein
MRCNPLRWLWGVVLIAGLVGIMHLQGVPTTIESELQRRTQAALADNGLGWAAVAFSGRDAVLSGLAFEDGQPRKALELARATWGVRSVDNRADLIEEQKNYTWIAQLRDSRLRLGGFVPNENTRKAIIGSAKANLPQLEIEDRMKLARGAPDTDLWLGAVSFSLKQLADLKSGGRVEVDKEGLGLEGEAQDFSAYRNIKAALASGLPQGLKLKVDKVTAPPAKPFVWAARLTPGQLRLAGYVPSESLRNQMVEAARADDPKRHLLDGMQVASGEPKDVVPATTAALKTLLALEEGGAELKDDQLTVSGIVAKEETAEALKKTLKASLPTSIRLVDQIKFREPAIKPVSPYSTGATLEGDTLVLTGFAPSEDARAALIAASRQYFPGRKVEDRLRLATGTPEHWKTCFEGGLDGIARLGNGHFELINTALRVVAGTDDEDLAQATRASLDRTIGGMCPVDARITVTAPPEPLLSWRAVARDGELILEGEVPDSAVKSELAAAAAKEFASARLVDTTSVKSGPSRKWLKVSLAGLSSLSRLRAGEARISGLELILKGEARDAASAEAARQTLGALPQGYAARETIEIRTDAMIAAEEEKKRAAAAVEEEKKRATAAAEEEKKRAAAAAEEQRIHAQRMAEEEKRRAAEEAARQAQLAALTPQKREEVNRCQTLMSTTAQSGIINFERASAALQEDSLPTLSKLAEAANTCPGLTIDIRGHADAEGTPERNQRLSERRAQAVVDYLTANGVAVSRLSATGYGASRPIAPNDTPDSRAKNRRIEFIVRPN